MNAEVATMTNRAASLQAGPQLQWEVEQFLYREAWLLDEKRYEDWLGLLAEDLVYQMPMQVDRLRRDERRYKVPDDVMIYNDNVALLTVRVRRLQSGTAWSEDPPSRVRRLVCNVQIANGDQPDTLTVTSAFAVYVSRLNEGSTLFSGQRQDVLRRQAGGDWRIAKRVIITDQSVNPGNNLTLFL